MIPETVLAIACGFFALGYVVRCLIGMGVEKNKPEAPETLIKNYKDLSFYGAESLTEENGLKIKLIAVGQGGIVVLAFAVDNGSYWSHSAEGKEAMPFINERKLGWKTVCKHFPEYAEEIQMFLEAQV